MMLGATKGDPVAWMKDAVDGKDTTTFSEDIGVCLVLASADFPHDFKDEKDTHGAPIYGVTRGNSKHIHPQYVQQMKQPVMKGDKLAEESIWSTAGNYNAVITGFGDSVKQAAARAYKTADQLSISNPILRDDIGEMLKEQLPKLHAQGYALHCNYV
jgi:phosphoribosylamine-glycine ligase